MLRCLVALAAISGAQAFVAAPVRKVAPAQMPQVARVASTATMAAADGFVPDMQRRTIMNLVLLGGAGVPVLWMLGGFVFFFIPATSGGGSGGLIAKDALGDDVSGAAWIKA